LAGTVLDVSGDGALVLDRTDRETTDLPVRRHGPRSADRGLALPLRLDGDVELPLDGGDHASDGDLAGVGDRAAHGEGGALADLQRHATRAGDGAVRSLGLGEPLALVGDLVDMASALTLTGVRCRGREADQGRGHHRGGA